MKTAKKYSPFNVLVAIGIIAAALQLVLLVAIKAGILTL